jgi:gluconolactonase
MVGVFLLIVAVALSLGVSKAYADKPVDKPVTRLDPALDELISLDAKLDEIRTGYGFTEGLVWVPQGRTGYLLLSDMPANVIYKLSTDGKQQSIYLDHSGYTGQDIWRVGISSSRTMAPSTLPTIPADCASAMTIREGECRSQACSCGATARPPR